MIFCPATRQSFLDRTGKETISYKAPNSCIVGCIVLLPLTLGEQPRKNNKFSKRIACLYVFPWYDDLNGSGRFVCCKNSIVVENSIPSFETRL